MSVTMSIKCHEFEMLLNFLCLFSRRARRQDIKHGDPASQCWDTEDSMSILLF